MTSPLPTTPDDAEVLRPEPSEPESPAAAKFPKLIYIAFADSSAGRHIRKWSAEPFDGGKPYVQGLPTAGSPQEQWDIAHRDGAYTERCEIETRFWSIVDRDGLSGLPSDMWAALESLVTRWRSPTADKERDGARLAQIRAEHAP